MQVFADLEDFWDDLPVSRLKYNAIKDFQDYLPGSLLTESSHIFFVFKPFEHFLICGFFRSRVYFGIFMGSLLGSLLKYNALEEFSEDILKLHRTSISAKNTSSDR
ncbi:hypothetical protein IGI04_035034 [Brassica rapa subsp. trilocularis]|uniref:Uncharacterized protein n=1 Tax=Brassica rapa subsp. trilocularis TaxID=1813537 RepID=A0ABQ7LDB9_BRACM|nr:hypothetical protein IGI04_035034 [Brassica rapa subsp. trilocularis]